MSCHFISTAKHKRVPSCLLTSFIVSRNSASAESAQRQRAPARTVSGSACRCNSKHARTPGYRERARRTTHRVDTSGRTHGTERVDRSTPTRLSTRAARNRRTHTRRVHPATQRRAKDRSAPNGTRRERAVPRHVAQKATRARRATDVQRETQRAPNEHTARAGTHPQGWWRRRLAQLRAHRGDTDRNQRATQRTAAERAQGQRGRQARSCAALIELSGATRAHREERTAPRTEAQRFPQELTPTRTEQHKIASRPVPTQKRKETQSHARRATARSAPNETNTEEQGGHEHAVGTHSAKA